jgi:hypothetical protein
MQRGVAMKTMRSLGHSGTVERGGFIIIIIIIKL